MLLSDVWRLFDVCLSVAYIGPNSRTERPRSRKTKIGTEVAHVTCDLDTSFKVKRSTVKVTRPLWLVVLAGQHEHTVMVTYPYAYITYRVTTCRPGRRHIVAAGRLQLVYITLSTSTLSALPAFTYNRSTMPLVYDNPATAASSLP